MATITIINGDFETGDFTGWDVLPSAGAAGASVVSGSGFGGTYWVEFTGNSPGIVDLIQTDGVPVWEGVKITGSCEYDQGSANSNHNWGQVYLAWYDASDNKITENLGNLIKSSDSGNRTSTVSATAPANTASVRIGMRANKNRDNAIHVDNFRWDLAVSTQITLTFPINGAVYGVGDSVPFRSTVAAGVPVASVEYIATDTSTSIDTSVGVSSTAPYDINYGSLPSGNYSVVAKLTTTGGYESTSNANLLTIGTAPTPTTREFKASNAYTYLVGSNFSGIASAIPSTARVVGVKAIIDYEVAALIRSLDAGITDPTVARYQAAFDMVPTMTFETVLLSGDASPYTAIGSKETATIDINSSDFLVEEDGTSEGKRWTVLSSDGGQVEIGGEASFFGQTLMAASDFFTKSLAVRAYPNLAPVPSYTGSGDACFRVFIDKLRIQVYFDPGSVEYYFVSPDETQVLKGRLVHFCVDDGDFRNGDASGSLQIEYVLELQDGTQQYVGPDWTIHSEYPPTDANRIGDVVPSELDDTSGMDYNGLPTQWQCVNAQSRYLFITHNFYGDKDWDAMYGVNGVDKAFSYNGEWFYKICTNPDAEKDKPRHVAHNHQHLALGFEEGRVDISVVGQPYNYSGVDGASSWAIGDRVTGLLPLSGTILGVFGSKSIWGISGTTVDNFATQVLVPNIGATEYTIVDMGFPVYTNAYGIYTLSQTAQYGDYLGTPMSADVSPWVRPRLIRDVNSDKQAVVAWPVRAKNQYRISFSDGYVLSMTLNGQATPTFSPQKYFFQGVNPIGYSSDDLYSYPAIVPAAVSSQLDHTGKERIHIAPYGNPLTILPSTYVLEIPIVSSNVNTASSEEFVIPNVSIPFSELSLADTTRLICTPVTSLDNIIVTDITCRFPTSSDYIYSDGVCLDNIVVDTFSGDFGNLYFDDFTIKDVFVEADNLKFDVTFPSDILEFDPTDDNFILRIEGTADSNVGPVSFVRYVTQVSS